ncbi:hypothetical protein HI914_05661 [Erysiphe necator]|nr:hypothetical protein HI914_05661 [Erysiphe necator]
MPYSHACTQIEHIKDYVVPMDRTQDGLRSVDNKNWPSAVFSSTLDIVGKKSPLGRFQNSSFFELTARHPDFFSLGILKKI